MTDNKTVLQALALVNDCNKYKTDLTTNGVVITDAIKFVQTNKEKLMSANIYRNRSPYNWTKRPCADSLLLHHQCP